MYKVTIPEMQDGNLCVPSHNINITIDLQWEINKIYCKIPNNLYELEDIITVCLIEI